MLLFIALLAVSGLLVLIGADWGMFFSVASAIVGLVWGVYGAWIFLTLAGTEPEHAAS